MRLTPSQRDTLLRVIDTDPEGRSYVAGHQRVVEVLVELGLAEAPAGSTWRSGDWQAARLTESGEQLRRDIAESEAM